MKNNESEKITFDQILDGAPISELNLSVKNHNVLMRQGVKTILQLLMKTEEELEVIENGHLKYKNGLDEVKEKINSLNISGLHLGMTREEIIAMLSTIKDSIVPLINLDSEGSKKL